MPAQKRPPPSPSAAVGDGSPPPASPPPASESPEKKSKLEENGAVANGNGERPPARPSLPARRRRPSSSISARSLRFLSPLDPGVCCLVVLADSGAKAAAAAGASESESEDADAVNQEYVLARPPATTLPRCSLYRFPCPRRCRRRFLPDAARVTRVRAFASLSLPPSPGPCSRA
jgi:hypothetical protein